MSIINSTRLNKNWLKTFFFPLFHASVMLRWILFNDDWLIVFTKGKLLSSYLREIDPQNDARSLLYLAPSADIL